MHLIMILFALTVATTLRMVSSQPQDSWRQRWQRSLFSFLFPPLLLLMTALAVFCMGPRGQMLGLPSSWFSYCLTAGFLSWALLSLCRLAWQGWHSQQQVRRYSQQILAGKKARILEIPFPYSAQIGFWQPELVVSRGMLATLDSDHLEAVLAHEEAHYQYRDTFWFFWLGWLRSLTAWLPQTEALWQEILLLREMRADRRAAATVDPLVLAESLLKVAQQTQEFSVNFSGSCCAALNDAVGGNRLTERIEALLTEPDSFEQDMVWTGSGIILAFTPLLALPFHHSFMG